MKHHNVVFNFKISREVQEMLQNNISTLIETIDNQIKEKSRPIIEMKNPEEMFKMLSQILRKRNKKVLDLLTKTSTSFELIKLKNKENLHLKNLPATEILEI